ncbi:MAG TPA: low molecular weight protein-tyrosine-phosphatase [Puia sp.]|nr:low molecular weight protein-tyrosine-phosphatase [Puia sp.]
MRRRKVIPGDGDQENISPFRESSDNGPSAKPPVASFLMICLGNICRSPLAEGILQHKARLAGLDWEVDSAGTNGYHIGEAPHPFSQKVARLNGIDISHQHARKFVADDYQRWDKIYVMAEDVLDEVKRIAGKKFDASKTELLMNEAFPGMDMDVPDPWSGPESGYHEVFKLIDKAAAKIIERYKK